MKYISKYFYSSLFIVLSFVIQAQETIKKDTLIIPKTERYGLRLGVDLFRLTRSFYEKDYRGIEVVGDYRLTEKYYIAGELGNESKTVDEDYLNFTSSGTYFKVGFDYNAHKNWLDLENAIYIGMRYGASSHNQTINNYQIYTTDPYFNNTETINSGEKFSGLTSQWLEVVVGTKTKVINNFYVGFSFRINRLLTNKTPDGFESLYIPGFNRKYSGDFGVGFNYTVSYFLPLYKADKKVKKNK